MKEIVNIEDLLKEFERRFPFRRDPASIKKLTAEKLYKPFHKTSFFYWIETKLRPFGSLNLYSKKPWVSAQNRIKLFKSLLVTLVNDKKSIHEKIDAPWEDISGFGGDKHNAKKILCCYYRQALVPIFNTKHMESFISKLGMNKESKSKELFKESYLRLSLGKRYEVLNNLLLDFKKKHKQFSLIPNVYFMKYLYGEIKDKKRLSKTWQPEMPEVILAKTCKENLEYKEPEISKCNLNKVIPYNGKDNRKAQESSNDEKRNHKWGRIGEKLVLEEEKRRLRKLGLGHLCKKVRWIARDTNDKSPYDILSFTETAKEKFVEVKTTTGRFDQLFYTTATQINFSKIKGNRYYLYRIYEFNPQNKSGKYFMRKGPLAKCFELVATEYQAALVK